MSDCKQSSLFFSPVHTSYSLNSYCLKNIPTDCIYQGFRSKYQSAHYPEHGSSGNENDLTINLIYTRQWLTKMELNIIFFWHFSHYCYDQYLSSLHLQINKNSLVCLSNDTVLVMYFTAKNAELWNIHNFFHCVLKIHSYKEGHSNNVVSVILPRINVLIPPLFLKSLTYALL